MVSRILNWLVTAYGLLLTLAAGGLVGANLFGFLAGVIVFAAEEAPAEVPATEEAAA